MAGHDDPRAFYVDKLAEGITIAAAFWPKKVIIACRTSSNEYRNSSAVALRAEEENRCSVSAALSRYISESFRDCF